jgi:uncharacterized membrane protein
MPEGQIEKNRLETFCDGVVAIVLTLMVLELKSVVFVDHSVMGNLKSFFSEIGPSALIYFLSFITIAIMWVNHHHMFLYLKQIDTRFLWLNIGLLFWMSMIPMPTALLGRNFGDPAAMLIYGSVMTANTFWFMILRRDSHRFAGPEFRDEHKRRFDLMNLIATLSYAVGTLIAFVSPWISLAAFVLIPALYFRPDWIYAKRPRA